MKNEIKQHNLFPLKLAVGERFCNRLSERTLLENHIKSGHHVLLMSPRRYGKSSLVHYVLNASHYTFADIDLFVAYDDLTICKRICDGISQIIRQLIPFTKKALDFLASHFQSAKIMLKQEGFSVELNYGNTNKDIIGQINVLLGELDAVLKKKSKQAVIFIDEFQDLAKAEHTDAIQGAIRNIAQRTNNIIFIFSGSSRRLLSKIFDDRSKPLYKLCKKINLDRILEEHYYSYIQTAAKKTWQKSIKKDLIVYILQKTECHPFYVNMLCGEIWPYGYLENIQQIDIAWERCFEEEKRTIETELSQLTANQLKVLQSFALNPMIINPLKQNFLNIVNLPASSVQRVLDYLIKNDYIDTMPNNMIRIIDPLLAYSLVKLAKNKW